jgi:hypothetical protein
MIAYDRNIIIQIRCSQFDRKLSVLSRYLNYVSCKVCVSCPRPFEDYSGPKSVETIKCNYNTLKPSSVSEQFMVTKYLVNNFLKFLCLFFKINNHGISEVLVLVHRLSEQIHVLSVFNITLLEKKLLLEESPTISDSIKRKV